MKKLILSLAILGCTNFAYSQFGVRIGYNSTLTLSDLHYSSQNFGQDFSDNMHIGAFFRLNFDRIYIQPELLYSMQGKDYRLTFDNSEFSTADKRLKIRAIDMPIFLGYKLLDSKSANVRAFAGPKLRFNAGSSLNYLDNFSSDKLAADFRNAVLGFQVGVGIDLFMFTFDIRYSYIGNLHETTLNSTKNSLQGIPPSGLVLTLGWKIL